MWVMPARAAHAGTCHPHRSYPAAPVVVAGRLVHDRRLNFLVSVELLLIMVVTAVVY